MDSGNSGSLQSSSGGDGGAASGDVQHPSTHFNSIPMFQPRSKFFDQSSFSQPLNPNPNPNPSSVYDLDSLWSRNPTPNPVYNLEAQKDPYLNPNPMVDNTEKLGVITKNPKKRTRASRRAPTTVLTTDTTNFRQMVQEFTGIPAAPFATSSSSSSFSRRIDLYGGGITPVQPLRPSYLSSDSAPTSNFQLPPLETHGVTKQSLSLSNLQHQMFPFQSLSESTLQHQVNVTERESRRFEHPDVFVGSSSTSLKRWRGENESLVNLEGGDRNIQNAVVQLRNDGDQNLLPGNEDSWISPSD